MFNMVKKLLAVICVVAVLAGALPLCSYASGTDNAGLPSVSFTFSRENWLQATPTDETAETSKGKFWLTGKYDRDTWHTVDNVDYYQQGASRTIKFYVTIPETGYYKITRDWYNINTVGQVTTKIDGTAIEDLKTYSTDGTYDDMLVKNGVRLTKGDHAVTIYTKTSPNAFHSMTFTMTKFDFSLLEGDGDFTSDDFSNNKSKWNTDVGGYYQPNNGGATTITVNAPKAGYYDVSSEIYYTGDTAFTFTVNGNVILDKYDYSSTYSTGNCTLEIGKPVYLNAGENTIIFQPNSGMCFKNFIFEPATLTETFATDGIVLTNEAGTATAECTVERYKTSDDTPRLIIATYKNDTKELIDAQLVDFTLGTVGDKETKTVNVTVDGTVEDIRAFLWTFDTNGDISKIIDFVKIPE